MKHILFILNVPSFYKINLLNELCSYFNVTGIFLGTTNQVMTGDVLKEAKFSPIVLSNDDMDRKIYGIKRIPILIKTIKKVDPDYIVYGGWDNLDMLVASFFTSKRKNSVICESSIFESSTTGIKGLIKNAIVSRFSKAFPSGKPHLELLRSLKFKGVSYITGSVGVNTQFQSPSPKEVDLDQFKYIFIGRLLDVKAIEFLVDVFNKNGKKLTVVGDGPLKFRLNEMAKPNINLVGSVSREEIDRLLHTHHCLILPSKSEPWGLVVEEALQCGVPVIASNKVGSSIDLINDLESGLIFTIDDENELNKAMIKIEQNYNFYRENALKIDFDKRTRDYIDSFVNAFNN